MYTVPKVVLRKFSVEDAPFIYELLTSPSWLEHIGDKGIRDEADAISYIKDVLLRDYAVHGFGMYAIVTEKDKITVGMCGCKQRDYLAHPDVGYALLPQHTGNGYAHASCLQVIDIMKNSYHLSLLYAITSPNNDKSRRVLEQLDFQFEESMENDGTHLELFSRSL